MVTYIDKRFSNSRTLQFLTIFNVRALLNLVKSWISTLNWHTKRIIYHIKRVLKQRNKRKRDYFTFYCNFILCPVGRPYKMDLLDIYFIKQINKLIHFFIKFTYSRCRCCSTVWPCLNTFFMCNCYCLLDKPINDKSDNLFVLPGFENQVFFCLDLSALTGLLKKGSNMHFYLVLPI